jgi:PAS domain S-box-containing protein
MTALFDEVIPPEIAQSRMEMLFEGSAQILWVTDSAGNVVEDLPLWRIYTGQTYREIKGFGWLDAIHENDRPHVIESWKNATVAKLPFEVTYHLRRKDGKYRWFVARATPLFTQNESLDGWVGSSIDMTEHFQDKEGYFRTGQCSFHQIETIFNSISDGIMIFDSEGNLVRVNLSLYELLGLDIGDPHVISAQDRQVLFQPSEITGVPISSQVGWKILQGESIEGVEQCITLADGRKSLISLSGAPLYDNKHNIQGGVLLLREITELRRLQMESLLHSKQLAVLGNLITDGLFIYDLQGEIIYLNEVARSYGYTDANFWNMPTAERYDRFAIRNLQGQSIPQSEWPLARFLKGEAIQSSERLCYLIRKQDGKDAIIHMIGNPIYDEEHKIIGAVAFIRDLTTHVSMEQRLHERELQYHLLFETMSQGVVYQDANGYIVDANAAGQEILGLTLGQLQGRTSFDPRWRAIKANGDPFPGEEHPAMVALKTGHVVSGIEMGVFNPNDNDWRWILIHGVPLFLTEASTPTLVYAVFEDITERKRLTAELKQAASDAREREQQLDTILNTLETVVLVCDTEEQYIKLNRAGQKYFGELHEIIAKGTWKEPYFRTKEGNILPSEQLPHWRILQGETITCEQRLELVVKARDSQDHVFRFTGAPIRNTQGAISGAVVAVDDLTELLRAQQQEREAAAQSARFQESERLKSTLLHSLSHDLKTPLAIIQAATTSLAVEERDIDWQNQRQLIDTINMNVQRLSRLINNALEMSKLELETPPIHLQGEFFSDIINPVIQEISPISRGQHRIHLEIPYDLPLILVDVYLVQQVFFNLLDNAIRYSAPQSSIYITAQPHAEEVLISIRDEGIGIPEEEQSLIFTKWYRGQHVTLPWQDDPFLAGSGLGLSICQSILHILKGRIWVESQINKGSTFWIALPATAWPVLPDTMKESLSE